MFLLRRSARLFSTSSKNLPGFKYSGTLGQNGTVAIGQTGCLERQFNSEHVTSFAELSGDFNPVHFQKVEGSPFDRPIVHGMLYSTMFGTTFATMVPGVIYLSQNLKFPQPVYVDDIIRCEIKVEKIIKQVAFCKTTCTRVSDQVLVVTGQANVLVPVDCV